MANLERSWNAFVRSLIQTKESWERFRTLMDGKPNLDHLDGKAQKYMSLPFRRSPFFKAMPDFIRIYGNSRADLKELLIPEGFKDKPKKD